LFFPSAPDGADESLSSAFSARLACPAARSAVLADSLRASGDHAESVVEAEKAEFKLLRARTEVCEMPAGLLLFNQC